MLHIIKRIASRRRLSIIPPPPFKEETAWADVYPFPGTPVPHNLEGREHFYDVIPYHAVLDVEHMVQYLRPAVKRPFFFSIVRETISRELSAMFYAPLQHDKFANVSVSRLIEEKLRTAEVCTKSPRPHGYVARSAARRGETFCGKNELAKSLGWYIFTNSSLTHDRNDDLIGLWLAQLDKEMDLVLLTERYDEGLVLLAHMLGCRVDEFAYAVENSNTKPHDRTPPSRSEKAALHEHSYVDVKLYEYFRAKFEQRWASLPQTQQGYGLAKLRNASRQLTARLEAEKSAKLQRTVGRDHSPPLPPPARPSIRWHTAPPDLRFARCAVVGSGSSLVGRSLGQEIDAHDLVARINSLPQPDRFFRGRDQAMRRRGQDIGEKTDLLFGTFCQISACHGGTAQHGCSALDQDCSGGQCWPRLLVQSHFRPDDSCSTVGARACNFSAMVFKASSKHDEWCGRYGSGETAVRAAAGASNLPLGVQENYVSEMVHHVRRSGGEYQGFPTTGFHAVVTLGLACDSVDLYGFSGESTADNHQISSNHRIAVEHAALNALIQKSLSQHDFPDPRARVEWERARVRHAG